MKRIANKYGTPLYLYNGDSIKNKYLAMKNLLFNKFDLFFSVKANPSLGICQLLQQCGSGIEVASAGELLLAIKAGYQPKDILFSGPGKTYEELEYAVEMQIAAIIVESLSELAIINSIAEKQNRKIDVGIRINPSFDSVKKNPVISMMGVGTQFGVDQDQIKGVIDYIHNTKLLNLICFHIYAGSQICDYNVAATYFEESVMLLEDIIQTNCLDIKIIDFGGGFGISYDGKKNPFDFYSFSESVSQTYKNHTELLEGKRLIFESGRFLLAESGNYLTKVQYRKMINNKKFLITDGGMNQNALSTFREKKIRGNFIMHILDNDKEEETITVAGPLCTPDDIIGRNVTLNHGERGDIVCVHNSGAYGSSFSPIHFLGHPAPCEVLVYDEKEYVLRDHGKKEDILIGKRGIT